MTHTEESLMALAFQMSNALHPSERARCRDNLLSAIREVLEAKRQMAQNALSAFAQADENLARAEKAEAECKRLKALCVGCLNIYYVVDPPFPADAMKNYLEEEGINLEHYTYKKDQP